jgi:hypothetical protein
MTNIFQTEQKHPLQNRVDPFGELIRTKARGAWMGNRGLIHNEDQEIVRPFRLRAWITCVLQFKNRQRSVMTPGLYTELFFLDEATSFSAGHRPCAECRRADFNRFKAAWVQGNPLYMYNMKTPVREIDEILQKERMDQTGSKLTYKEKLGDLPEGSFIVYKGKPFIVRKSERLAKWTPFGYADALELPGQTEVDVLTPKTIINTFRFGYIPKMHESSI